MPREVKAYLCKFRCGRKATTRRKTMLEHEEHCWHDPAKRACPTCEYNHWVPFENDTGYGSFFECRALVVIEWADDQKCAVDCQHHKLPG